MNIEPKKHPENLTDSAGESMKDSMAESSPGNDNSLIKPAEELTDNTGKLDPDQLEESYNPNLNEPKDKSQSK